MTLTKVVDQETIELSSDEEAVVLAEWAANAPQPPTYAELRRLEYPPIADLIVALWEFVIEDRPESKDALQVLRLQIKEKYPKP